MSFFDENDRHRPTVSARSERAARKRSQRMKRPYNDTTDQLLNLALIWFVGLVTVAATTAVIAFIIKAILL